MQGIEPADAGNESILVLEVKASLVLNEVSSLVNRWEYEGVYFVPLHLPI